MAKWKKQLSKRKIANKEQMGKQLGFPAVISWSSTQPLKVNFNGSKYCSEHDNSEGYVSSFSTLKSPWQATLL